MQETDLNPGHQIALQEKFRMKSNLRIIGALAVLATLALAASCRGFFQNPVITSVTIDPSAPTVSVGQNTQLTALGQDNQGDAPTTLSGGTNCTGSTVCWSSATPSVATITTGGLLKGISAGTSTITASSGTASATATATVTLANVTSIMILPQGNISLTENTTATQCVTAKAQPGGIDVTESVTWQTGTSGLVDVFNQSEDPMCVESTGSQTGTTTLFATYQSGNTLLTSNTVTVTVNP
jgi:trimeric autotransporter adhesin